MKLLALRADVELTFEQNISKLCSSSISKLIELSEFQNAVGQPEKTAILNKATSITSLIVIYCSCPSVAVGGKTASM